MPISSVLRAGITHDDVSVEQHTKVIEIDPREQAEIEGIGERPARIAEGVLTAIQNWEKDTGSITVSGAK
ncbi:MAG: hypothetical protein MZV65_35985 [Chromatiales bacterium]|nr:hypothetical protein [Chromatiales bacterium]